MPDKVQGANGCAVGCLEYKTFIPALFLPVIPEDIRCKGWHGNYMV